MYKYTSHYIDGTIRNRLKVKHSTKIKKKTIRQRPTDLSYLSVATKALNFSHLHEPYNGHIFLLVYILKIVQLIKRQYLNRISFEIPSLMWGNPKDKRT